MNCPNCGTYYDENENDGTGRKGWMEYNSGIGASKQVDLFGTLKLYK